MTENIRKTPAFLFDIRQLQADAREIRETCRHAGCALLYPLKTCPARCVLEGLVDQVDGFSVSSANEARLARDVLPPEKPVHLTTPGLRHDDVATILENCNAVACNSVRQYETFRSTEISCGLRVNPGLSIVSDMRYDPCRPCSKLGIPLPTAIEVLEGSTEVEGIHFHTNSESRSFAPLLATVEQIVPLLAPYLPRLRWLNLGGGYLFEDGDGEFRDAIDLIRKHHPSLNVFCEPGTAVVADCCRLETTVLDILERDGKRIVVLDTTVSHMPEVFEYPYVPGIVEEDENGVYRYLLAGCTCLAGDLFGEHAFSTPLAPGRRLQIESAGSYSIAKAHMFNGVNLPAIYARDQGTDYQLLKKFEYRDYLSIIQ